ncbi:KxYKxGKxW signal peptide domain-containing protein [Fructobacillus fructosus]|nr:Membrane protein TolA involved in colicin uptake (TolA) [Fructobacillus fructosus]CAK1244200.1 Membrane protein TolA involved in colicin uptake (TolA) [Fructobacillus fructosus]CAK1245101.1 Membrane protein TolA involved in colicin uptake (TolA) [Fructobacillus fructosus]
MNKEYIKKEHYKMYKAGKRWIYAAVAAFSLTGVGASVASNSDFGHLFPLNSVMDTIG